MQMGHGLPPTTLLGFADCFLHTNALCHVRHIPSEGKVTWGKADPWCRHVAPPCLPWAAGLVHWRSAAFLALRAFLIAISAPQAPHVSQRRLQNQRADQTSAGGRPRAKTQTCLSIWAGSRSAAPKKRGGARPAADNTSWRPLSCCRTAGDRDQRLMDLWHAPAALGSGCCRAALPLPPPLAAACSSPPRPAAAEGDTRYRARQGQRRDDRGAGQLAAEADRPAQRCEEGAVLAMAAGGAADAARWAARGCYVLRCKLAASAHALGELDSGTPVLLWRCTHWLLLAVIGAPPLALLTLAVIVAPCRPAGHAL